MTKYSLLFCLVIMLISKVGFCQENGDLTAELIRTKFSKEKSHLIADKGTLYLVYIGEAEKVLGVLSGEPCNLSRLPDTKVWVYSKKQNHLAQGIISYTIIVEGSKGSKFINGSWRGKKAPSPVKSVKKLSGTVEVITVKSEYLESGFRKISVYVPPKRFISKNHPVVFLADGQRVSDYAKVLEPLITDEIIEPTILVGVHSGRYAGKISPDLSDYDPKKDLRRAEYLPSDGSKHFRLHQNFFCEEVVSWIEKNYPVSKARADRILFGVSNGGRFAANTGCVRPDVFGTVLGFSLGRGSAKVASKRISNLPAFFFVAGEWEEKFRQNTEKFYTELKKHKANVSLKIRKAGHDGMMWKEEFVKIITNVLSIESRSSEGK